MTCGVARLGGGNSVFRTDDPRYGIAHCRAVERVGKTKALAAWRALGVKLGKGKPPPTGGEARRFAATGWPIRRKAAGPAASGAPGPSFATRWASRWARC